MRSRWCLVIALGAVTLAGCGSEAGDRVQNLPTPTRSITVTPTGSPSVALPTASAPESASPTPTSTNVPDQTDTASPSPTRSPRPTRTPQPTETVTVTNSVTPSPTPTPTRSPTATVTVTESATPTPTPTPTESPSPTASPSEAPAESETTSPDEGVPAWVWWLLAAVLLASAIGIPLLVRSRRRTTWQRDLAAAEAEVAWLARQLVPELKTHPTAWTASHAARVAAAEDSLGALAERAPDEAAGARALALRDATRDARARIDIVVATGAAGGATELDAVVARLEAALAPTG